MMLKIVVSVCPWPGDSCCRILQLPIGVVLACLTKAQRGRSVVNLWMLNSTTAVGADTEAVLIAGMRQWPDALLM